MTITGEAITFPAQSMPQLQGYLARPDGDGPFPALVVIHEAFGLNDDIRAITRRFAGAGYVALAVDLFSGRSQFLCMARLFAGMLRNSLDHAGVRDLKDALTFLERLPGVDTARIGAVGYCMGGSLAIALACSDGRLKAIAPYYAMNPRPVAAVARACPVVGSYPERDFTAKAGSALEAELDKHGVAHDIKIYPAAGHSFFNGGRNHNPEAAQDSWQRVMAFFGEHISSKQ
ncbi:MAG TPA: dienelactone hydrolase family protein [Kouleothrix sp.]|uniref:dienelactone hydrolase family protein n=1 Tax=Kouleothrix sp. TaxID=2779161 RepID=UPI002B533C14|nr:dienelactone hydrolase family protein [Kouleothrix sp.]